MKPLLIILPILLIGGTIGAAYMGVIQVPGVTPKKAEAAKTEEAQPTEEEATQEESASQTTEDFQSSAPSSPDQSELPNSRTSEQAPNAAQGAKALAKYWDEISIQKLIPITDAYGERDLAQVLFFMQRTKVAELLSSVTAERAAKLSRELQHLASARVEPD
jgi:hypothetical protein